MMSQGRRRPVQEPLFVTTTDLYRHIPQDPFYTRVSGLLNTELIYRLTKPLYHEAIGRPSLDPVVFFKCLLFGFFEQVTSYCHLELRLAESLTARRFLGYALDEKTPDESTLRKTLALFPDEVFKAIFDDILAQCQRAGLLTGRHLGVDSTTVEANASLDSLRHRTLGCTYREYLQALRRAGEPEPTTLSNADWVSPTDPDARIAKMKDGHTDLAYKVSLATDLETGIVVAVDVTTADVSDRHDLLPVLEQALETLETLDQPAPETVVADKGYHDGAQIADVLELALTPCIRVPAPSQASAPGFAPTDFVRDATADQLRCPAGAILSRRPGDERFLPPDRQVYQAAGTTCRRCPHFGVCTKAQKGRKVIRSCHEEALQANAAAVQAADAADHFTARQTRGEAPFSYGKHRGRGRIRGRGIAVAYKQTLLGYLAWNCRRLLTQRARTAEALSARKCAIFGLSPRHFRASRRRWAGLDRFQPLRPAKSALRPLPPPAPKRHAA
jgi:transposase